LTKISFGTRTDEFIGAGISAEQDDAR